MGVARVARVIPAQEGMQDVMTVSEAARWLSIPERTLEDYITDGKFSQWDGYRKIGRQRRIFFPTMRERLIGGALMTGEPHKNGAARSQ